MCDVCVDGVCVLKCEWEWDGGCGGIFCVMCDVCVCECGGGK